MPVYRKRRVPKKLTPESCAGLDLKTYDTHLHEYAYSARTEQSSAG